MEMETGTIVEFSAGGTYRLGMVAGELGKKKLIVWTEHGDEMRPERGDITLVMGKKRADNPAAVAEALRELRAQIAVYGEEIDLEVLWEIVGEMGEPLTAAQIAELMFTTSEYAAVLAILGALRADSVYFKSKRDSFEARPRAQVETQLAQRAAEGKKARERNDFSEAVAALLAAEAEQRKVLALEHGQNDAFRNYLILIKDYAVYGDELERHKLAEELLDELEASVGRKFRSRGQQRAFDLLVDLGIWGEHENLWLYRFGISPQASKAVLEAAQALAAEPWVPEPGRRDLSALYCVTIDDAETRDIDDALSCEPLIDGGWKVGIHIADPGARVAVGSLLDEEARSRGTSIYLPTGPIPMFPNALSEAAMSLVAGELRPALSIVVTFDANFEIVEREIFSSTVCVDQRLTYDEVDRMLAGEERGRVANLLQNLNYVGEECMSQRDQNGALSINLPEVKVRVDMSEEQPRVNCALLDQESSARLLVSEMMILCNHVLADFCDKNNIPTLYRCQDSPDSELLDEETLALPEGLVREFAMLRKMKRGDVTTQPSPHFGLGLSKYVQASSPIRRYGDLVCQRQIKAFLAGEALPYDAEGILGLLAGVDGSAREGSRAERETNRYWLIYHLAMHKEPLEAVVVELKDAQGTRASVFVNQCAYKTNCSLKRQVPLGATIEVVVDRADPRKDILILREA
ncbi:MAG: VacB/RNase II family 3'-5' exoribonuclease [Bradymonadaceae bacterium]|nr:VacB/RNase II family 3'-5' exoribonuclease [Lujinxingiaceae bacterium]